MRKKTQHKTLALDGGGIRGVVSVEVLARIEALLRDRTGQPDLRLADWFDLIAGTSAGAITAALLAIGYSAEEVRHFYDEEAEALFRPARLRDRIRHLYDADYLATRLQETFGADTTLGSDSLRTLLLLVLRNATTDSPWFLSNNPAAKFNDRSLPGCNLDLPLWQLVRASSAAPVFFEPEVIDVGPERFVFADGALTGYINPAFKAFLLATVEPYGLSWPTGTDRLLLVSVGTGTPDLADHALEPEGMHLLHHAVALPQALISASRFQQDFLCRVFGDCLVGDPLDLEVGDLIGARGPVEPKLFTYLRYDLPLTPEGLESVGCAPHEAKHLGEMDDVSDLPALQRVGRALASARVRPKQFSSFLPGASP